MSFWFFTSIEPPDFPWEKSETFLVTFWSYFPLNKAAELPVAVDRNRVGKVRQDRDRVILLSLDGKEVKISLASLERQHTGRAHRFECVMSFLGWWKLASDWIRVTEGCGEILFVTMLFFLFIHHHWWLNCMRSLRLSLIDGVLLNGARERWRKKSVLHVAKAGELSATSVRFLESVSIYLYNGRCQSSFAEIQVQTFKYQLEGHSIGMLR